MAEWLSRFEQLEIRERLLLVAVAVLVVYLLVDILLLAPATARKEAAQGKLQNLVQKTTELKAELQVLTSVAGKDPDGTRKKQVAELRKRLSEQEQSLTRLSAGLIPAEQLPVLLQEVLQEAEALRLQSVQTAPVIELTLQGQEVNEDAFASAQPQETAGVFKHPVEIRFHGSYAQILDYLQTLEDLRWRIYWEAIEYAVLDYPRAEVGLQVYTLSTEQGVFVE